MLELVQTAADYSYISASSSNESTGQQMAYPEAYRVIVKMKGRMKFQNCVFEGW